MSNWKTDPASDVREAFTALADALDRLHEHVMQKGSGIFGTLQIIHSKPLMKASEARDYASQIFREAKGRVRFQVGDYEAQAFLALLQDTDIPIGAPQVDRFRRLARQMAASISAP